FNGEQFASEAIEQEPTKQFGECKHITESRNDPDSDLFGYSEKVCVKDNGKVIGCLFIESCEVCAHQPWAFSRQPTWTGEVVARKLFYLVSKQTLKAILKNPGDGCQIILMSKRAQKLAAEAVAEGPG